MSVLASFSQRFSHIFLFIFFECIAFFLIINFNHRQRDIFLHSSSLFSGKMLETRTNMTGFFDLRESNDELKNENAELLKDVLTLTQKKSGSTDTITFDYEVIPAKVINNSIMSMRNYITIDKGRDDGISLSMGVITTDGVVGIVKKVGSKYSTVMSMLNVETRVSASIKKDNFFGTASWDGTIYNELSLSDVPIHAQISIGDSIITNGYSTIFPKGIDVGVVKSYTVNKNGAFYDLIVTPSVDFTNLDHVYLLKGTFEEELISIQSDE